MDTQIKTHYTSKEKRFFALSRARGIPIQTDLREYGPLLEEIRSFDFSRLDNRELERRGKSLKKEAPASGARLPEVFALLGEACFRVLGYHPYNTQFAAGIALHKGKLIQMQTGEGKTLAAMLAGALNALEGAGVHIFTANDYLACRDARWMGPVYAFLGLEAGAIGARSSPGERKAAYSRDITYLTAREGGFDYLREGLVYSRDERITRGYNMAIVDEADFILIDEARVPLVIAGESEREGPDPVTINRIIPHLAAGKDFSMDRNKRKVVLTPRGQSKVEELLGCGGMHEERNLPVFASVNVALHAHYLLSRDVDYIVRNGEIELVDEFTGRVAHERRWPYGIQSALEAREGLEIKEEGKIYSSLLIRHFISLYPRTAAMTATAVPSARELKKFYDLDVVVIPPHKPVIRIDSGNRIFRTRQGKREAVIREVRDAHTAGRPVLVGTASVGESLELAGLLKQQGIDCQVLNAGNDFLEAELIARAGMYGAVTISTNMAGRGTDILLGGKEGRRKEELKALGGLYVIGTNLHESRRVDDQLRGRAGRQGDPGLSRFFLSLEDPLFLRYGIREFLPREVTEGPGEEEITSPEVCREVNRAQEIIEDQNYVIRRTLGSYSAIVEKQRAILREIRDAALFEKRLPGELLEASSLFPGEKDIPVTCLLYHLDNFQADHLAWIDYLKEGIYLHRFAGEEPLLEYIRSLSLAFEEGLAEVMKKTADSLKSSLVNFRKEMKGPSSTWTYTVSDDPLPGFRVSLALSRGTARLFLQGLKILFSALDVIRKIGHRLFRKT